MARMAARSAWALSAFFALVLGQGAAGVDRQGAEDLVEGVADGDRPGGPFDWRADR
jgi:hypothetical protein